MNLYLDTSALIKRYVREEGTPDVVRWVEEATLSGSSLIARAEMAAAISRLWRMKALNEAAAVRALAAFRSHWPTYARFPLHETTVARADELAWQYGLRGYDAVHLASAVLWQEYLSEPVTLATYDRRLGDAARTAGLAVLPDVGGD